MRALPWLDPVLGSAAKVRLLRTLTRSPGKWFTEADLARSIGMSPNTVNLALRDLAGTGVVQVLAMGRAHQVRLDRSAPLATALSEVFRSETKAVAALAQAIRGVLGEGESCLLFGSAARGTMAPTSDVDLLIVAPSRDAAAEASVRVGQAARRVFRAKYRMLHYTPGELRRKWDTPLLRAIRSEGVLLAGEPLEDYL